MFLDGIAYTVLNSKDYSTLALWIPKIMLESLFSWPGTERTFVCLLFTACNVFVTFGIVSYFIFNISDYKKAVSSLSLASMTFQAVFKLPMLVYHSKKWHSVLQQIRNKFWPFDILDDEELEKSLKNVYSVLLITMILQLICGVSFTLVFISSPLLFGAEKTLPFPTKYFFDWSVSPTYELMYCFQSIVLGYIMFIGAAGVDFLILIVCACISAQYRILQYSFLKFDKAEIPRTNAHFKKLGEEDNPDHNEEKKYLVRCIKHHKLLLRITRNFNECSSPVALFELCVNVIGICLGLFETTKGYSTFSEFAMMSLFLFANTFQLVMYCGIGNELKYQASILPQCIYLSSWNEASQALRKDIMFVLAKSQQDTEVTTYDLYTLDFNLFIKGVPTCICGSSAMKSIAQVIKVSFSGYTLLSKMSNK